MIWVNGQIVPDDALRISALDRTFEHGLGLFETFRTWSGHATLLKRHLGRMLRSAQALRIPLRAEDLPSHASVAELLVAEGIPGDAILRIVASGGGESDGAESVVWMRVKGLAEDTRDRAVRLQTRLTVAYDDPLARHKTLNYWARALAHGRAKAAIEVEQGGRRWADALAATRDGRIWETTRANIFGLKDRTLCTPELDGPILPGVMRGAVIEVAERLGFVVMEADVGWDQLDDVFLTNSGRGIMRVVAMEGLGYPRGTTCVDELDAGLQSWLRAGGDV